MLVPSCARAKAKATKKTPARFWWVPSLRKDCKSSRGFQIGWPKMTVEEEETIIPIKDVIAKPTGMVMSCDQRASLGLRAKRAKSGSFLKVSDESGDWKVKDTYHNECCKVGNSRHNPSNHSPGEPRAMGTARLVNNWTNPLSPDTSPDKERNAGRWDNICLDREQMANFVDRKPNGWKRTEPENEERHKVSRVGARVWNSVRDCEELKVSIYAR